MKKIITLLLSIGVIVLFSSCGVIDAGDNYTFFTQTKETQGSDPLPSDASTSDTSSETEDVGNKISIGKSNALLAAKTYVSTMAFSHDKLIEQLKFEHYTDEEATYGADHCGADWNEQALKSAENFLNTLAFSESGLAEQLKYEMFTDSEVSYAVSNCGADWNEQAVKAAKNYLNTMALSKEQLIQQLEFAGFTHEQAVHGTNEVYQ